jgi:acetoin utilization deacetylase AcuC-like enzyme
MPDLKDLERGHDRQYLQGLLANVKKSKACAEAGEDPFISDFGKEADITPGTLDAARLAVGAAYDTIDILLQSKHGDTAFGLVWPPGLQATTPNAIWRWASVTYRMRLSRHSTPEITLFSSVQVIPIGSSLSI